MNLSGTVYSGLGRFVQLLVGLCSAYTPLKLLTSAADGNAWLVRAARGAPRMIVVRAEFSSVALANIIFWKIKSCYKMIRKHLGFR